jgi:hypothetical protein
MLQHVKVVMDREDPTRSRGFAFITFATPQMADAAITANGSQLAGRSIAVRIAQEKGSKDGGGFRGRGGGFRGGFGGRGRGRGRGRGGYDDRNRDRDYNNRGGGDYRDNVRKSRGSYNNNFGGGRGGYAPPQQPAQYPGGFAYPGFAAQPQAQAFTGGYPPQPTQPTFGTPGLATTYGTGASATNAYPPVQPQQFAQPTQTPQQYTATPQTSATPSATPQATGFPQQAYPATPGFPAFQTTPQTTPGMAPGMTTTGMTPAMYQQLLSRTVATPHQATPGVPGVQTQHAYPTAVQQQFKPQVATGGPPGISNPAAYMAAQMGAVPPVPPKS